MSGVDLASLGGWPKVLGEVMARQDLARSHARAAMDEILAGNATSAQVAAFVVALRTKGETTEELRGLLDGLLAACPPVPTDPAWGDRLIDVVGTGGDRSHSINVSTLSAVVVAAAGGLVCKHGNRAASSACGAADVLEALGATIELSGAGVASCITATGLGFCFAQRFHASLRHAGPTRRELGVPTAFNVLGPLANPARVSRMLLGVADPRLAGTMVAVLAANGASRALVVHGHDGLDELSVSAPSTVWDLRDGVVTEYELDPMAFGIARSAPEAIRGGDPATNAAIARRVLAGEAGPPRDIVVLNAGAACVVAGLAESVAEGIELAGVTIDSGKAAATLERFVAATHVAAS